MNDNDINEKEVIDAMSYCFAVGDCDNCAYRDKDCADLMGDGLLIINRQKAEIEKLCNKLNVSIQNVENMAIAMPNIAKATRDEAIKEFAERLKQTRVDLDGIEMVAVGNIDTIVKEMTEE